MQSEWLRQLVFDLNFMLAISFATRVVPRGFV
jgi:hypothetical protein